MKQSADGKGLAPVMIIVALLATAGFWLFVGGKGYGAGGRTIHTESSTRLTALYGFGDDQKLRYTVFVRFPNDGRGVTTRSNSRWVASATQKEGPEVELEATDTEIRIDGHTFNFDAGRIFVVRADKEPLTYKQLDLPIGLGPYTSDLDRIVGFSAVDQAVQ